LLSESLLLFKVLFCLEAVMSPSSFIQWMKEMEWVVMLLYF